jgi:glycosyltransferase involved in cell wall biosynthesis
LKAVIVAPQIEGRGTGASRRVGSISEYFEENGFEVQFIFQKPRVGSRILRFTGLRKFLNLRRLISHSGSDISVFCGIEFFAAARFSPTRHVAIDVCDSQSSLLKSRLFQSHTSAHQLLRASAVRLMYFLAPRKAHLTYITEADRQADFAYSSRRSTVTFGNLPDMKLAALETPIDFDWRIGFVADFSYAPNKAGLNWFMKEVFPFLAESFQLNLYGPVNPDIHHPRVSFHGYIPNLQSIYSSNDLFIAPDFGGAGQKNKVIEALVVGKPIVASVLASSGFERVAGLYSSDDSGEWVSKINALGEEQSLGFRDWHAASLTIGDVIDTSKQDFREWLGRLNNG